MKLSVIGLGKLGLPFALFLASHGFKVFCFDINKSIKNIEKKKKNDFLEPQVYKYIKKYNHNVKIVSQVAELVKKTDITFLVLPTPSKTDGNFSNKYILTVLNLIGKNLVHKKKKKQIINITSTVSPSSCDKVFIPFLEKRFGLRNNIDFFITYNPHFIAQGSTIENLNKPSVLLLGTSNSKSKKILTKLYKKIYKNQNIFSYLNLLESEIAKLSLNVFVTNKISFSNYISELCEYTNNANASKILKTIGKDSRIGPSYMKVGTKFSGPCFPRDNKALIKFGNKIKLPGHLLDSIDKINNRQSNRLVKILSSLNNTIFKKKINIGILGLTYKKNTDIVDDSQGLDLIKSILSKNFNFKKIFVFDKYITDYKSIKKNNKIKTCNNLKDLVKNADIIFIMYKDNYFLKIKNFNVNKLKIIVDCWNLMKSIKKPFKLFNLGESMSANIKRIKSQ